MKTIESIQSLITTIKTEKLKGAKICLVPTMGNLHEGHLALVKKAKSVADIVVVSIFVNPLQFNDKNDLVNYPRTLEDDLKKLESVQVDIVFTPDAREVYGDGEDVTYVNVLPISEKLEGASRPGHFRGVSTIVSKLFNMVMPDVAIFGEKDFQQLLLIKQMVRNMNYAIEILSCPIERAESGLALSSRNNRLSENAKSIASNIYKTISNIKAELEACTNFDRNAANKVIERYVDTLTKLGFTEIEINIQDSKTLEDADEKSESVVVLIAAKVENVRLIDNIVMTF